MSDQALFLEKYGHLMTSVELDSLFGSHTSLNYEVRFQLDQLRHADTIRQKQVFFKNIIVKNASQ